MANAVTIFETALAATSLRVDQKDEVKVLSDQLCRDLWLHFCDHEDKHLDAIALADPSNVEVQARVTTLKQVVASMRANGMPDVALLGEL